MPRRLRAIDPGYPHHVTQRGVNRQPVFFTAADRVTYLSLVESNLADTGVAVLAYCLMTNHVHWIVVPERDDSLAILFRRVHGRYAQYLNARRQRTGHLWQNRYYSCALARTRLWSALRYVELNPVRAGLAPSPADYRWSSAAAHLTGPNASSESPPVPTLDWSIWHDAGGANGWRELLAVPEVLPEVLELRKCTYSGKPFGPPEFLGAMEDKFNRHWQIRGRPRRSRNQKKGTELSASLSNSG